MSIVDWCDRKNEVASSLHMTQPQLHGLRKDDNVMLNSSLKNLVDASNSLDDAGSQNGPRFYCRVWISELHMCCMRFGKLCQSVR